VVPPREAAPAETNAPLTYDLTIWTYAPEEAWPDVSQVLADNGIRVAEHVEEAFQAPETGLQLNTCMVRLHVPRPAASRAMPRLCGQLADLRSRLGCDVLLQEHRSERRPS
jgi:hypothetical protein